MNCSLCRAVVSGDAITVERCVVSFIASASGYTHLHSLDTSDNDTPELGFQQHLSRIGVSNPVVEQFEPLKHSGIISLVEPFVISIIHSSSHANVATICSSNCILDPDYPAMEPSPKQYSNSLFDRRFGISWQSPSGYKARCLLNTELLCCYEGPNDTIPNNIDTLFYQDWLDDNLINIAPYNLHAAVTVNLLDHAGFNDDMIYDRSEIVDNHQCYQITASPTTND